jgi:hypothetical protein
MQVRCKQETLLCSIVCQLQSCLLMISLYMCLLICYAQFNKSVGVGGGGISGLLNHSLNSCSRVNVPNLAQVPNWRSLVKTSLELQSCPLFQINRLDQR